MACFDKSAFERIDLIIEGVIAKISKLIAWVEASTLLREKINCL